MTAQPKTILEEMLRHLDFQATVAEIPSEDGTILDITTDDSTRLIGRNGQIPRRPRSPSMWAATVSRAARPC
jgi:predicted RNA-binding protein Jag